MTCDSPVHVWFYNTGCRGHRRIPGSPRAWPPCDVGRATTRDSVCHRTNTKSVQDLSSANLSHTLHPDYQSGAAGLKFRISKMFYFSFCDIGFCDNKEHVLFYTTCYIDHSNIQKETENAMLPYELSWRRNHFYFCHKNCRYTRHRF